MPWASFSRQSCDSHASRTLRVGLLSGAYLFSSVLSGADLERADLGQANLSDADLSWADLREADLDGARGVTNRELEQQASLLSRTTMPNGQKYEDWSRARTRRRTRRATVLPNFSEPRGWLLSANNRFTLQRGAYRSLEANLHALAASWRVCLT
jgi:hypothetical protein